VAVINAKLSERSLRLHRFSRIVPRALAAVARIAAQTEAHAARYRALGLPAERIAVTGNMKYDLAADSAGREQRQGLRQRLGVAAEAVVVIGGSLHAGEDRDLLAAFAAVARPGRDVRLVIVPRYPEQVPAVLASCHSHGFATISKTELDRRSAGNADNGNGGRNDDGTDNKGREQRDGGAQREGSAERDNKAAPVIVVDTLGELRSLYAVADIAFVGGSLYYRGSNKGGHNVMEPAILGLPVIVGPHNVSFRETIADLKAADAAIEVRDQHGLTRALEELVAAPERRAAMGRSARAVVLAGQGASAKNLALLLPLIDRGPGCSASAEAAQCRHQTRDHLLNE
jgi:3-deoxy-D-manno-octulosonic-acid transferase